MTDQTPPAMDYDEHERTYQGFIKFTKIGTISCGTILLALILFTYGGGLGTFLGSVSLVAMTIGAVMGLMSSGDGAMPPAVAFGLSGLFVLAATL